jgi:uncharacterized membrane protein YhaH (DUF805 family)
LRLLFGFQGRAGRKEFLVSQLGGVVVNLALTWVVLASDHLGLVVVALVGLALLTVSMLSFGVRRTRDTGLSHWWYLLVLVPAVNLALLALLLLAPTDEFEGRRFQ